ncbi:hypothetical protein [Sciscionella sediminilitoris]|uniref:hypothetical protein n=1 Tax=Sciscionella sediminilitoris TaxID=1445613 RepID=UPI0004DEFA83|nr:hypothetical protein [Sciscionella sp. SE31]
MIDPRTPVLVGVGQLSSTDREARFSTTGLLGDAARTALAEAGGGITERIRYVGAVDSFASQLPDLAGALAGSLGIEAKETVATRISGTSPVELLADACGLIASGSLDAALLGGVEVVRAWKDGRLTEDPVQPEGTAPSRILGTDRTPQHEGELAAGLNQPAQYYPLFEQAIRSADGSSIEEHDRALGTLWSRFASVAAQNPHAWDTSAPSAADILATGPDNRMIAAPYRKLLTANIFVDQAAALVLCSAETATAAGIPRERWVFVNATASANEHWFVGEREHLHRSEAIAAIGTALREHTGRTPSGHEHLDLYSCFPCAVRVGADALGIDAYDPARVPTVTGGLTFAGGPGSNYVMHSLAAMTERLRAHPGERGLCTALGWFLTKHAAVSLSTEAPTTPYRHLDAQAAVDARPRRSVALGYTGPAEIETYTCAYGRDGEPETGYLACLLPDGRRAFAASADPAQAAELVAGDPLGKPVTLTDGARFRLG